MDRRPRHFLPISIVACASLVEIAYADGLGGLRGVATLYLIAAAVVSGGILLVAAYLIRAFWSEPSKQAKKSKVLLVVAIIYLLATAPVFIWILISPRLHAILYLIFILYLAVLSATVLQFYSNRRHVLGFAGMVFLFVVLTTPEIVSYTDYTLIDNVPLENTVQLTEQKDGQHVHLADGRIFRLRKRYKTETFGDPFATDATLMIEKTDQADGSGLYALYGVRTSQQYHHLRVTDAEPLFTIPLRSTTIEKHESYRIGAIELLDANWEADNRTLYRAIYRHCCDLNWINELVRRGADPKQITSGSRNVLHYLYGRDPESDELEQTAAICIEAGVDLNAKDQWGNTSLYLAIDNFRGSKYQEPRLAELHRSFVTLLLDSGADPNNTPDHGITPLHLTVRRKYYDLSRLLLDYGADPQLKNSRGESSFDLADARHTRLTANKTADLGDEGKELKKLVLEMQSMTPR